MSAPTTFDTSVIQRALGMSGQQQSLPSMDSSSLDQVLIAADMSASFASQRFEGRAFAFGTILAPIVGRESVIEVHINSPGGAVFERADIIDADVAGFPTGAVMIGIGPTRAFVDTGLSGILDVGGLLVASTITVGTYIAAPGPEVFVILDASGRKTFDNFAWFVPTGQSLWVRGITPQTSLGANLQWREIPQAAGS